MLKSEVGRCASVIARKVGVRSRSMEGKAICHSTGEREENEMVSHDQDQTCSNWPKICEYPA
eukprot:1158883-Pelagomonas_calceolata.AAC.23